MRNRHYLVTIAVLTTVVTGARGAAGQGSGVPGEVAFFSARSGNKEIYIMSWDGREPRRITTDPASDVDPAISPNGRDIVFTSNRTGNNDIYLVGSAGGNAVNLTDHPANDGWPRWSPNGREIVFHSNRDGNFEIYVMDADGGPAMRLTTIRGSTSFPTAPPLNQMAVWSPNGQQLAFMSARDGYPSVFLMAADGHRNLRDESRRYRTQAADVDGSPRGR